MIKKYSLFYFCTRGMFLGIGFSKIFSYSNDDIIFSIILGIIVGLIIIYFINRISNTNKTIYELLIEMKVFGKILIFPLILLIIYFLFYLLMTITHFIGTMYLTRTTPCFIVFSFILVIIYMFSKGINSTIKLSMILFIISVFLLSLAFISLIPKFNYNLLFPLSINKNNNIFMGALYFGFISAMPNFLIIQTKNKRDNLFKSYLFSIIFVTIPALTTYLLLGNTLSNLYLFPEYIVLRNVSLIDFFKNIENFIAFIWIFDIAIICLLNVYLLNDSIKLITNHNKIVTISIFIILGIIVCKYFIINYQYTLFVYQNLFYALIIFFIIIVIPLYIYSFKK